MLPYCLTAVMALCLLSNGIGAATAKPAQWTRVAYDDAGSPDLQPHLSFSDGHARFTDPACSDQALLTHAFGDRIQFEYAGLNPHAAYKARLRFLSDSPRELRVATGEMILAPSLKLEAKKILECEVEFPAEAFAAGRLSLVIEHVSDPVAVVSDVAIFSTDPAPLGIVPETALTIPHLSPLPAEVNGVAQATVDLAGTWRFNSTADIEVPGEWAMQGFHVEPDRAALFERTFTTPADWHGEQIKLRCDGVFSDASIWINSREAGRHLGAFTPFELDVTTLVKPGEKNIIKLGAINESIADVLASATKYAGHPLGGITRGIRLIALPVVNLSEFRIITRFDQAYRDATLELDLGVENATPNTVGTLTLTAPDGRNVPLSPDRVVPGHASIPVANPLKWDNEHPNLYTLTVDLQVDGKTVETVRQRVGFRQVEIRGNQVFMNNLPIKLRGCTHHETYPTTGRSVPPGISRRDIELFREGNVNLLRTSHYPPDEALLEAADELGMFIECEAPICWCKDPAGRQTELVCRQTAEMVVAYRNHPSILFWSLANESKWGPYFTASSQLVRQLDPTRPQTFNFPGDQKYTEIANVHYPSRAVLAEARANASHPLYHGEDSAVCVLNRIELVTDPGLRDLWGKLHRQLWDDIYAAKGDLGESIWAGVDDTFFAKDGQISGYGAWGVLDGWRRPKPEYWDMKKAYSPVRLLLSEGGGGSGSEEALAVAGDVIQIAVENRQNFSNLNEMKIAWKLGSQSGVASADVPPRGQGMLSIKLGAPPRAGDRLELSFTDPRGFIVDQFSLPLQGYEAPPIAHSSPSNAHWQINPRTGQLDSVNQLAISGPQLMLLPLNYGGGFQVHGTDAHWEPFTAPCPGWLCNKVVTHATTTTVEGQYDGAEGSYTFTFLPGGALEIAYAFTITKEVNPRQIGLVFTLPRACENFSWKRKGYWDVYPNDHIGRLEGSVTASEGFPATGVGPRTQPDHPWRLDNLPYGNNDFCSTKHNVIHATLTDSAGHGIAIDGRGRQHVRCWRTHDAVNFLVADYSVGGIEPFIRTINKEDYAPLKPGDKVTGTVRLDMD